MFKEILNYPNNEPLFYSYLIKQGFTKRQLSYYVKNGQLERVAHGVYKKKDAYLEIPMVIKAIQEQLSLPFIIGGQSALELQGISYYGYFRPTYYVYKPVEFRLNDWLKSLQYNGDDDKNEYVKFMNNNLFKQPKMEVITDSHGIKISDKERAIIEMAETVNDDASYEDFIKTLEMLFKLRYDKLQRLLESCTSIKAKRIFLQAADRVNYPWFKYLNPKNIELGKGPRQLVSNGVFNKRYKIIVPR